MSGEVSRPLSLPPFPVALTICVHSFAAPRVGDVAFTKALEVVSPSGRHDRLAEALGKLWSILLLMMESGGVKPCPT